MIELRPYQINALNEVRDALREHRSVILQSPTGAGKTNMATSMVKSSREKGKVCFFLVHRKELVKQVSDTFNEWKVPHSFVAAGRDMNIKSRTFVCGVQTMINRLDRLPTPDLIITDECHHCVSPTYMKILAAYPKARNVGLTATPERLDGEGLGQFYTHIVMGPTVKTLIDDGFLAPYRLFAPSTVDLGGIKTIAGDFAKGALSKAMDKPKITGDAIEHYKRHLYDRRAVVFCVSREHSRHVVEQFRAAGIVAEHVDGETPGHERDAAILRFKQGKTKVLSNVDLFGEGFDLPAIEGAILLRPTKSLSMYLQQVGRCLRTYPGKDEAIILDHAGNSAHHGKPDDDRSWTLAGREKGSRKAKDETPIKMCPMCYATVVVQRRQCSCGYEWQSEGREIQQVDGELVEIHNAKVKEQAKWQKKREQARAETREELITIAQKRGYSDPGAWAHFVIQSRKKRRSA